MYPKNTKATSALQNHVRSILPVLLSNKLIPEPEMHRLLTDKDYCYMAFGLIGKTKARIRYKLLSENKEDFYDEYYKQYKCWVRPYCGYYICSQWYQSNAYKFANWLLALSRGQLESTVQSEELLRSNLYYESGVDWEKNDKKRKKKISPPFSSNENK